MRIKLRTSTEVKERLERAERDVAMAERRLFSARERLRAIRNEVADDVYIEIDFYDRTTEP